MMRDIAAAAAVPGSVAGTPTWAAVGSSFFVGRRRLLIHLGDLGVHLGDLGGLA